MLVDEAFHVFGERIVVVSWVVRRVSMVTEILENQLSLDYNCTSCRSAHYRVYGPIEVARKSSERWVSVASGQRKYHAREPYLLMLLLFFLEPKRPWAKIIGALIPTGSFPLGGSCRSYARSSCWKAGDEEKRRLQGRYSCPRNCRGNRLGSMTLFFDCKS